MKEQSEINVTSPFLPSYDRYIEEIRKIWDSHILSNMGPIHGAFESQIRELMQVPECALCCNGHLALELLIKAMRLEGEVITTPFTFVSTTNAIVRNGLVPVFCDIREEDYTMDPRKVESLITERTAAILPVHVYGNPCQVEELQEIADRHHIKLIYDAAHAFGVTVKDRPVASYGDGAILSFHATKPMHSIEGGAVVCREQEIAERVRKLRNFGIDGEDVTEIGINAKMNEFQAAMGLCNLEHFRQGIEHRKKLCQCYREQLGAVKGIQIQKERSDVQYNYAYMPIRITKELGLTRDELHIRLEQHKIHARKYFYPLTCDMSCYREIGSVSNVPVARQVAQEILTLPLYDDLEVKDVEEICAVINNMIH